MGNNILTLLKLDFKARFARTKRTKATDYIKTISNVLFTVVIYAVLVVGVVYLTRMFVESHGRNAVSLRYEYLVLATAATMVIQCLICTGTLVKNLFFNGDNELLLRFPVNGNQIFTSKSLYVILHNIAIGVFVVLPFYISFGVITSAEPLYYLAAAGVFLLSTLLPYFLANIIAIPVMTLVNVVKNRFLIILILLILMIGAGFAGYMVILKAVLTFMQDENVSLFSPAVVEVLRGFASKAYPFKWYGDILARAEDWWLSLIYIVLVTAAFGVAAFFIMKKFYYRTILHGIETEKSSFKRRTLSIRHTQFGAIIRREFLMVFRSFNYSFQYFAMACAAPVMVYFCNDLASSIGEQSVGSRILPGLTLLVVIIFVTIIVSFASTSVSREGNTFYQTKTIPVRYTKQILAKLLLYAFVATASVLVCCVTVYYIFGRPEYGGMIKFKDAANIFIICELLVITLTCSSIKADVKTPTFNVSGDGELVEANKNVSMAIFFGCLIAIGYGIFAMVFSYLPLTIGYWRVIQNGIYGVYPILIALSSIMAVASVGSLFYKLDRNYGKIVP
ncbi:MAG TPA: hypothetical protein PK245_00210 [Clostridia bacterium]|nr:hypothetical protein [Clostridia bacterium]HRU84762.1 hypothetical protein [Eubacteriales bacterium]